MQMFTDFNNQKKRGIRIAVWIRDRLVGAREGIWQRERKTGTRNWKRLSAKQREAWSRGREMQMLIDSVMKNLLIKLCFIWEQSSF